MKYDAPKEFTVLSTILTSTGGNSTYPKAGVSFSVDSFVVVERSVGRIKIYGEKYAHSQSA
ncbi:MAG: hypothetical protein RIR48_1383 [Bacteroidota bacterium]|jgi:hypothetical protein